MDGLVDPLIQIQNLTSDPQLVRWRVTAVDINGSQLIPVANDTGVSLLQPGDSVIQRFDWIKLESGIGFNVVEFISVDQLTSEEQIASIAQTVYSDDVSTLKSTGLFADITPSQIILSTRISLPSSDANISLSVFLAIFFTSIGLILLLVLVILFSYSSKTNLEII